MSDYVKNKNFLRKGLAQFKITSDIGSLSLGVGADIPVFQSQIYNDSVSITKTGDDSVTLLGGRKYLVRFVFSGNTSIVGNALFSIRADGGGYNGFVGSTGRTYTNSTNSNTNLLSPAEAVIAPNDTCTIKARITFVAPGMTISLINTATQIFIEELEAYIPLTQGGAVSGVLPMVHLQETRPINMRMGASATVFPAVNDGLILGNVRRLEVARYYVSPAVQNTTQVKYSNAASASFYGHFATNLALNISGAASGNQWQTANGTTTGVLQFNIGEYRRIDSLYYINAHDNGSATTNGVNSFALYGSNDFSAWSLSATNTTTGWEFIPTSTRNMDIFDGTFSYKKIDCYPTQPYTFYKIICDTNHGGTAIGLRKVYLGRTVGENTLNATNYLINDIPQGIILPPGRYYCEGWANGYRTGRTQAIITQFIAGSRVEVALIGDPGYSNPGADYASVSSRVSGHFTCRDTTTIQMLTRVANASATYGYGLESTHEPYGSVNADLKIWRVN